MISAKHEAARSSVTKLCKSNNHRVAVDPRTNDSASIFVLQPDDTGSDVAGKIKANLGLEDNGEWTAQGIVEGVTAETYGLVLLISVGVINLNRADFPVCRVVEPIP